MNEIHDDGHILLSLIRKPEEMIDLRAIAVDQSDPAFLSFCIPVRRFFEHRRDHFFRRMGEAGPDAFVFWPWPRRLLPRLARYGQDFFRSAHKALDGIDGGHRGHSFGVLPATAPQPCREFPPRRGGRASFGL